jgi:hypothetical protein
MYDVGWIAVRFISVGCQEKRAWTTHHIDLMRGNRSSRSDVQGRRQILRLHAKTIRRADDTALGAIAARTPGMVGSDLADELDEAIERLLAGPQKKSCVITPEGETNGWPTMRQGMPWWPRGCLRQSPCAR